MAARFFLSRLKPPQKVEALIFCQVFTYQGNNWRPNGFQLPFLYAGNPFQGFQGGWFTAGDVFEEGVVDEGSGIQFEPFGGFLAPGFEFLDEAIGYGVAGAAFDFGPLREFFFWEAAGCLRQF